MIPAIRGLAYSQSCCKLDLFTLAYRRIRGDLIFLYRIIIQRAHPELDQFFPRVQEAMTRGHNRRLKVLRTDNLPHVYRLSRRTIPVWNGLLAAAVNASTIAAFKHEIDQLPTLNTNIAAARTQMAPQPTQAGRTASARDTAVRADSEEGVYTGARHILPSII